MTDLIPTEPLIGPEGGPPGILDRYEVRAIVNDAGKPLVFWYCAKPHGDGRGYAGVIARDLDGDQSGLTIAELAESAIEHECEEHSGG